MKLRYLGWVLAPLAAGVAAFVAQSGDWSPQWTLLRAAQPILECPPVLELGERELGEVALARFTVANRGSGELLIDQVRTNCACTGLERVEEGKYVRVESLQLGSREEADLVMRVLVQGTPGSPAENGVVFRTNDPTRPEAAIGVLVSKVRAGANTVPTSVVFGELPLQSHTSHVLEVFDAALRDRKIARVATTDPTRVSVRLLPLDAGDKEHPELGKRIGRVEVTALTDAPGPLDSVVEIHLTGDPRPPTRIPVSGRVVGLVELSPSTLLLPRISEDGPLYFGTVHCRSRAQEPLTIRVESVPDGLSATVQDSDDDSSQRLIRIEWEPSRGAEQINACTYAVKLRAVVNGDESVVDLPVVCVRRKDS